MPGRKPAGGQGGKRDKDGPSELLSYIVAYAKQETLDPVVRQAKALGKGIAGALLLSIGTVLLGVGFLRALEAQFGSTATSATVPVTITRAPTVGASGVITFFTRASPYGSGHPLSGDWSWVPYMGGALFCILVAVFCVARIVRGAKR